MRSKLLSLYILLPILSAWGAEPLTLTPGDYLQQVFRSNMSLACEQLNLSIADAEVIGSKVFNDPTLSVAYANNDDHRMQMGQSVEAELAYTISPGKRGARINLAKSERELAQALFSDFLRNLRFEATVAYAEAIRQQQLYDLALESFLMAQETARADSIRLSIGDISPTDAMQTNIDARLAQADLANAKAEYYAAGMTLASFIGLHTADTICLPTAASTPLLRQEFSLVTLTDRAITGRADLMAAMKDINVAQKALIVEKKERNLDFDIALGYNYNTEVRNEIAPAPRFSGISIGVGIPLKFSNSNRGALTAARLKVEQAELAYRQACADINRQVAVAYNGYNTSFDALEGYHTGILDDSADILQRYRTLYTRREVSLVEYKEMRQAQIDLLTAYIEAQFQCRQALATLEYNVGSPL